MTVICAWCLMIMRSGHPDLPVTHGICAGCEHKHFPIVEKIPVTNFDNSVTFPRLK